MFIDAYGELGHCCASDLYTRLCIKKSYGPGKWGRPLLLACDQFNFTITKRIVRSTRSSRMFPMPSKGEPNCLFPASIPLVWPFGAHFFTFLFLDPTTSSNWSFNNEKTGWVHPFRTWSRCNFNCSAVPLTLGGLGWVTTFFQFSWYWFDGCSSSWINARHACSWSAMDIFSSLIYALNREGWARMNRIAWVAFFNLCLGGWYKSSSARFSFSNVSIIKSRINLR